MNHYAVTKKEYTDTLTRLISPFIYEGFSSIYNDAKQIVKEGEESKLLKVYQQLVRNIPKWNDDLVNGEAQRILISSKCDWLQDLLKAVIKSNIILLSNSTGQTGGFKIDKKLLEIPFNKFIHRCYIECAREIYNNPYLFYHREKPLDIKRNQRETKTLIKSCIEEAIRKMLPVEYMLKNYLTDPDDVDFDNVMSEQSKKEIQTMITKDLNEKDDGQPLTGLEYDDPSTANRTNNNKEPIQQAGSTETSNLINEVKKKYLQNTGTQMDNSNNQSNKNNGHFATNNVNAQMGGEVDNESSSSSISSESIHNTDSAPYRDDESAKYEAVFSNVKNNNTYSGKSYGQEFSTQKKDVDNRKTEQKNTHSEKSSKHTINYNKEKSSLGEKYYSIS